MRNLGFLQNVAGQRHAWMMVGVALAGLGWFAAPGCGSDEATPAAAPPNGQAGESCTRRSDCDPALMCVNNVCVPPAEAGSEGGPSHSQRGESCAARSDCELGLACLNNVCVTPTDQSDASTQAPVGQRGESCRTRIDCASGLTCLNGTCQPSTFGITPTGNECVRIECRNAADCCGTMSDVCADYKKRCDAGQPSACSYFNAYCNCDESLWSCTKDTCESRMPCGDAGTDAAGYCRNNYVCVGGTCVQCAKNTDCYGNLVCQQNKCVTACKVDHDCNYFEKCDLTNGGKCVPDVCNSSRECVASSGNALSTCANGKCRTPCSTDSECNAPIYPNYARKACVSGYCQDIGCETAEECRILLRIMPGSKEDAECRPKATP